MGGARLALIAGRGGLPAAVAGAQGTAPLVCALEGHQPDHLEVDHTFRIEHLGSFLTRLRDLGVAQVCFCGAITRPDIDPARIDAATVPLVPVLARAVAGGEDSALRAVLGLFEDAGFTVRAAHDLAPDLLPVRGVATRTAPPSDIEDNIPAALTVLRAPGQSDLGQACVIRAGRVIAREDTRGTDAMLGDLSEDYAPPHISDDPFDAVLDLAAGALDKAADWLSGPVAEQRALARGGFLFKAPKPGQDLRVDLPTIGPQTAMRAAEAGLDGIVIPHGGVMVMDAPQVVRILDGMGMFLWVR